MPTIEVYDPPLCCASGVCGPNADRVLTRFAADLEWLQAQGISVSRRNPAEEREAALAVEAVQAALADRGEMCLPLTVLDKEVVCVGRYPSRGELAELLGLPRNATDGLEPEAVAELIAIGASVAANCDSCLRYHARRGEELGLTREDMASAANIGLMVKQVPQRRLLAMAQRQGLLMDEDEDGDEQGTSCCDPATGCCTGTEEDDAGSCCG